MHLLDTERRGTSIEGAHLVVGVRDSFVHLCSNAEDRLEAYRQHFETVYVECLTRYYQSHAAEFLADNGVHDFMRYADSKLKEEEERGLKYLETSGDSLKKASLTLTQTAPPPGGGGGSYSLLHVNLICHPTSIDCHPTSTDSSCSAIDTDCILHWRCAAVRSDS